MRLPNPTNAAPAVRATALQSACVALVLLVMQPTAWAQTTSGDAAPAQRVEITGSSIKRIAAEGALPVTVLKAEDIRASGVTSAVDLVKKLTSAQGAVGESTAVGFASFGFAGISIHNLGEARTLVLLNGRRLAPFGGQDVTGFAAGFDLNAIPLSAIERVELLTDGASALYGADAIGGVVNFITKRNVTEGDITLGFSNPAKGAQEKRISATKGFGSLDEDGYNVMLSFGHDQRTALKSADRSFGSTGQVNFTANGKQYQLQRLSLFGIPANAVNLNTGAFLNPALAAPGGACPAKSHRVSFPAAGTFPGDDYCGYDAIADYEIYPERKRDNFMATWTAKLGNHEIFADMLLSRTSQTSRIAATQGQIPIAPNTPLPGLPGGLPDPLLALYRIADLGQSIRSDTATFSNVVLGSRGEMFGWDYSAGFSTSTSRVRESISGFPGTLALDTLAFSGLLDPFVGPGQQSAAGQAAIAGANYRGYWTGGVSRLDTLSWNGNRELTQLPGGPLMLGAGVNFNREHFESRPSLFAQGLLADPALGTLCDGVLLPCDQLSNGIGVVIPPYSASRTSQGLFGELVLPVTKQLELGAGARFDRYSDFGNATTGKASFRWTPMSNLLVRGSIGTGFRAPTVPQVKAPVQTNDFTGGQYACAGDLNAIAAGLGATCTDGSLPQLARGNPDLKPEKSKQATLGMRFEPTSATSFGADLWHVQVSNRIGQLPEGAVFANPLAFPSAFSTQTDAFGTVNLAYMADNRNLGKSYTTGLDLDFSGKMSTGWGMLASQLTLTQVLREVSQIDRNGPYFSAVGNFADLGTVTFRTQGRWVTSLKTGPWTNTMAVNFKSGYKDQATVVNVLGASGAVTGTETVRVHVGSYATLDWQTAWAPDKRWSVVAGALNLTNRKPPFVASFTGTNRGLQVGYDDRYYDARGRTFYLNGSYKF